MNPEPSTVRTTFALKLTVIAPEGAFPERYLRQVVAGVVDHSTAREALLVGIESAADPAADVSVELGID